ncbi:MAG: YciI family protein [Pseudomonadota bacterium]
MMQFAVTAYDGADADALQRRIAAREAHLALGDQMIAAGQLLFATALLNAESQMCGSIMMVDFESRTALEEWLKIEPYVTGQVWQKIDVVPCKVGPRFVQKTP